MSSIIVRLAGSADRPALLEFIRDHWSATHVFVDAPEVFDWQYLQADTRLNMVMAELIDDTGARQVLGVLGFIPLGRFDAALGDRDVLLALWKVRDDLAPPGLGLRLLKFIQFELKPRTIAAIGISTMVAPIYRAMGYSLGRLHQSALFATEARGRTQIATGVPAKAFDRLPMPDDHDLRPLVQDTDRQTRAAVEAIAQAHMPQKSWAYLVGRYMTHPWYDYALRLVSHEGVPVAVVIWRKITVNGAAILRIVDIVGDTAWLARGQTLFMPELTASGAEYIDLMQLGTASEVLQAGGFVSPEWHDGLVLPNYFAPFEARNIEISLSWKQFGAPKDAATPLRLYRADSDQDRPNRRSDFADDTTNGAEP